MNAPQQIAPDILCLAHTAKKIEWCDRAATCERHVAIRRDGIRDGFGVLFRVCQPGAHDRPRQRSVLIDGLAGCPLRSPAQN